MSYFAEIRRHGNTGTDIRIYDSFDGLRSNVEIAYCYKIASLPRHMSLSPFLSVFVLLWP